MTESELLSIRIFLVKVTLKISREKTIGSFYEKELLGSILLMSYYSEPDSHIRDKVEVVLDLELEHDKITDTSKKW